MGKVVEEEVNVSPEVQPEDRIRFPSSNRPQSTCRTSLWSPPSAARPCNHSHTLACQVCAGMAVSADVDRMSWTIAPVSRMRSCDDQDSEGAAAGVTETSGEVEIDRRSGHYDRSC
jgi:hypothetical protein